MYVLYTIIIRLYGLLLIIVAPFNKKAKQLHQGRRNQERRLITRLKDWTNTNDRIWIHAASYGEYEMARPIVRSLLDQGCNQILVTFHSPSGYLQASLEDAQMIKAYLPLDIMGIQKRFVHLIQPTKVVFIKYEFWFNLLRILQKEKIDFYYTSLHLRKNSYLFWPVMSPFLSLIKASKHIYCHNQNSQTILTENDFHQTSILGDTRINQVQQNLEKWKDKVQWSSNTRPVIALGNITKKEIPLMTATINQLQDFSFIIAPHDPKEDTEVIVSSINESVDLYSSSAPFSHRVLVLNTMGDLRYIYGYCDLAYVGGGFEKGPHNLLEPLIYGKPIMCGPNIDKFPMAEYLSDADLLKIVSHPSHFKQTLLTHLKETGLDFKERAVQFFKEYEDKLPALVEELIA